MKYSGTISRGVRTPIIKKGDDLASIVVDSVVRCVDEANLEINDKDVVAITEAVVGIAQGNYATADQIAKDVANKFGYNYRYMSSIIARCYKTTFSKASDFKFYDIKRI